MEVRSPTESHPQQHQSGHIRRQSQLQLFLGQHQPEYKVRYLSYSLGIQMCQDPNARKGQGWVAKVRTKAYGICWRVERSEQGCKADEISGEKGRAWIQAQGTHLGPVR